MPQTEISFKDVRFMTPLPPDELSKRGGTDYERLAGELPPCASENHEERDNLR